MAPAGLKSFLTGGQFQVDLDTYKKPQTGQEVAAGRAAADREEQGWRADQGTAGGGEDQGAARQNRGRSNPDWGRAGGEQGAGWPSRT